MPDLRPLIILPTYNERENIPSLTREIFEVVPDAEILVVDDASPDETADWVRSAAETESRLHLVERSGKLGLGTAYVAGFDWGLEREFDPILTMDADFSHHPRYLPALLALVADGAELAIGSRYVPKGGVRNWPFHRRLLSRVANLVSRLLLGLPVRDATAGFRAYRSTVLRRVDPASIRAEGYSFLEEMIWRVVQAGFRCAETPIIFEDRRGGVSKISRAEILRAVGTLARLRLFGSKPNGNR